MKSGPNYTQITPYFVIANGKRQSQSDNNKSKAYMEAKVSVLGLHKLSLKDSHSFVPSTSYMHHVRI